MKILIAGNWHSNLHEEPIFKALKKLGHQPIQFKWYHYFESKGFFGLLEKPIKRIQFKYFIGPVVDQINRDLITSIKVYNPDVVFVYRGILIYPKTIDKIKQDFSSIIIGYNNDDPFSPKYPKWVWRHFKKSVPKYDLIYAYRKHNLDEYLKIGAQNVRLLRAWFIPEMNHPINSNGKENNKYECDVVFVGHYEDDGRLEYLEEIVKQGWQLKLYGHGSEWDRKIRNSKYLKSLIPVKLVWGEDYNKVINKAKVALCFLSKLNRDTYTRRCFEIPASGTVLLSEYSEDLNSLYVNNREALFFKNKNEFITHLKKVLYDEKKRIDIAEGGKKIVWKDGHDIISRTKQIISDINKIRNHVSFR